MSSNLIKYIDSCIGNIARKIQDEFDESKHPRDKGGKFTSKGGEGRGGGKKEKLVRTHKAGNITPERADALNEAAVALEEQGVPVQKILKMSNEGDLEGMQKLLKGGSESSSRGGGGKEEDDDDAGDPVAKMRKHLDDDLFELATRSESEEEFISKAERRIKQDLWAAKSAPEELPVKGQKAEYALKKILSEIKSGTSEYW